MSYLRETLKTWDNSECWLDLGILCLVLHLVRTDTCFFCQAIHSPNRSSILQLKKKLRKSWRKVEKKLERKKAKNKLRKSFKILHLRKKFKKRRFFWEKKWEKVENLPMERNAKNCRKKSILCKFGVCGLFVWEQQQQQGGGGQAYSKIWIYHLDKPPLLLHPFSFTFIGWKLVLSLSTPLLIGWK